MDRGDFVEERKENRFRRFCSRHAFRPGSVLGFCALLFLVLAVLGFFSLQQRTIESRTTAFGLKNIGELSTQAGYFTTVQSITKCREVLGVEVPGTKSSYVYSYDGTIKAGIDFEDIQLEVDERNHVIRVQFPEFRILSTEIDDDSFVLYSDGNNLFTSLKLEDVNQSNAELKKTARETAIKNGILENARTNAELLVRGFLAGTVDLTVYTVEFLP